MSKYRLHQEGEKIFVLKNDQGDPLVMADSAVGVRDEIMAMISGLGLPVIDDRNPKKVQSKK